VKRTVNNLSATRAVNNPGLAHILFTASGGVEAARPLGRLGCSRLSEP